MTMRLTKAQAGRVHALARSSCCNFADGNCLLLDDGAPQTCVQLLCECTVCCRYFRDAVLPGDPDLYRSIRRHNREKM